MILWLEYLSSLSILLPALIALYRYRLLDSEMKIFALFLLLGSCVEACDIILAHYAMNNIWLFNLFSVLEGFVICYVIGKWFESPKMFRVSMVLFTVYFCYWIYTAMMTISLMEFNNYEKTVKGLIFIFLSAILLVRLSRDESIMIQRDYRFWIAAAVLVYFSATLIVFSTANVFLQDHHRAMEYSWLIHSVVNIAGNILLASGFIWYYRRMNSYT